MKGYLKKNTFKNTNKTTKRLINGFLDLMNKIPALSDFSQRKTDILFQYLARIEEYADFKLIKIISPSFYKTKLRLRSSSSFSYHGKNVIYCGHGIFQLQEFICLA